MLLGSHNIAIFDTLHAFQHYFLFSYASVWFNMNLFPPTEKDFPPLGASTGKQQVPNEELNLNKLLH